MNRIAEQLQEENENLTIKLQNENETIYEVKKSPFMIVKNGEEYFTILGTHRLTENLASIEEAIKDTKRTDWNRILQVIMVVNNLNK